MKAVQVPAPGAGLELVERALPEPGPGEVRVRVEACGVCRSDVVVLAGKMPGIAYPRIPGHEVAGRIDALGEGVQGFARGERAGVGWHGGHCGTCPACRAGDFRLCEHGRVTGVHADGGYAEYMVAPAAALVRLPEAFAAAEAAPLLCAGITTFNALRHTGARAGDLVAVQGIGGLGHLGLQFAHKSGFRTVAVSRGADKEALARGLGADHYVDAARRDPGEALYALGGARVILSTVPDPGAIAPLLPGLGRDGELVVLAAATRPLAVPPLVLVQRRAAVRGWSSGTPAEAEDTLRFSLQAGVRPSIETFPLARAVEAWARVERNETRFRAVLEIG